MMKNLDVATVLTLRDQVAYQRGRWSARRWPRTTPSV